MLKKLLLALSFLFVAPVAKAQMLVTAGVTGGSSFGNLFLGPVVGLEIPVQKHLEVDLKYNFNPLEQHIALGTGWAQQAYAGGVIWLTKGVGIDGNVEYSQYHVAIEKHALYTLDGLVLRKVIQGVPVRFMFNYTRQLNNGITKDGTESSHLQAGQFNMDVRLGCSGPFCYRTDFDFKIGHLLTQGNPQCDRTFSGPVTCPRAGATAGTFVASFVVEFPRRKNLEHEVF